MSHRYAAMVEWSPSVGHVHTLKPAGSLTKFREKCRSAYIQYIVYLTDAVSVEDRAPGII